MYSIEEWEWLPLTLTFQNLGLISSFSVHSITISPKFHENPAVIFLVILLTNGTDKQINGDENSIHFCQKGGNLYISPRSIEVTGQ